MRPFGDLPRFSHDPIGLMTDLKNSGQRHPTFRLGPLTIRLITDAASIYDILIRTATAEAFGRDNLALAGARKFIGKGIATVEGAEHKDHRLTIKQAFADSAVLSEASTIDQEAARTADLIKNAAPGQDIRGFLHAYVIRVTTRVLLGCPIEETSQLMDAAERFHEAMRVEFRSPLAAMMPDWTPFPGKAMTRRAKADLQQAISDILAAYHHQNERDDVIHLMNNYPGGGGQQLMPTQVTNLFVAGATTTLPFLDWTLRYLLNHPDWYSQMQNELAAFDPLRPEQSPITTRFIKESLRLAPPAWLYGRQTTRPVEIQGTSLKSGEVVYLCFYLSHRDATVFADPERFDPDRFLDEREQALPKGSYLPFAAGRHACLGQALATLEMRLLLKHLTRQHPEKLPLAHDGLLPDPGFTLAPQGQLRRSSINNNTAQ